LFRFLSSDILERQKKELKFLLAWAIAVHKSQGLTLKNAVMELGKREYADLWQFHGSVPSKIFYLDHFRLRDLNMSTSVKGYSD
jgi:hypothetical protein